MSQKSRKRAQHIRWLPYLPVAGLAISLGAAISNHWPLYLAMAVGSVIAAAAAFRYLPAKPCLKDADPRESYFARIGGFARSGASRLTNVVILILLVNAMTAVWFSSGTIQSMVYYGLKVMSPGQVMAAGLVISTLVSMMLGSSVGTVATVGVAVLGIAKALGLPPAPVAGAIMSGAVFGDRVSFLSPIFHLAVDFTGSETSKASRRIMTTGVAAWLVALSAYVVMGYYSGSTVLSEGLKVRDTYFGLLAQSAKIGFWSLVPPATVMVMAAKKVPVRICLIAGLVSGVGVAVGYQRASLVPVLRTALLGFHQETAVGELTGLLRSGGIAGTRDMILLLGFAGVYTGIMELSGMMEEAVRPLVSPIKTRMVFLMAAMGVSVFSAAFASNQAMSVILPARLMEGKRKETRTSEEDFAGVLSDSGVAAAAVIPWNVMAAICAQSLQVLPQVYAPYSFFLWALPVAGAVHASLSGMRHKQELLVRGRTSER